MHILWVNKAADFTGGAERYVARTARALRERGVRCTLLYGLEGWTEPEFTDCFDAAFPLVAPGTQVSKLAPDVVYVQRLEGGRPLRDLAAAGSPVVRFFHDHRLFCLRDYKYTTIRRRTCSRTAGAVCYPCLGFLNRSSRWPGIRIRTLRRLRYELRDNRTLDAFVVGSQYMKSHVAAHGFDPMRIHVIPPFVRPPSEAAPVTRDPNLILFVGALLRGKGLDVLIQAMGAVPRPATLRIIGAGRQEPLFRDQARGLGLDDRVVFAGRLGEEDVYDAYRKAACLVLPSRSPETFGMVGPEALINGTPVIATRVGGTGEWLKHGETGLAIPPGDVPALETAIQRILDDPEKARGMGEKGRSHCRDRFLPERHVEDLMGVFRTILASRRRS